jgi:hypothetical protein
MACTSIFESSSRAANHVNLFARGTGVISAEVAQRFLAIEDFLAPSPSSSAVMNPNPPN